MKLIIFSQKTLIYNSFLRINYPSPIITNYFTKVCKNLKVFTDFLFMYDGFIDFVTLNALRYLTNSVIKSKKYFLFFFVIKQIIFFFLFKKKYLYSNIYENFCFWKSNLNKFNKINFIFILNYLFVTSVGAITKSFFRFFKFLRFFSYNRYPGRRRARRLAYRMVRIFFKKIRRHVRSKKKHTQKTIFSLMYWVFLFRNYYVKKQIQYTDFKVELTLNEEFFFFNPNNIFLLDKNFCFTVTLSKNIVFFWKKVTNFFIEVSTHNILWGLGLAKFDWSLYLLPTKSTNIEFKHCFLSLYETFVDYNFSFIFEFIHTPDVNWDENNTTSIEINNLVTALADLSATDLEVDEMYERIDYKIINEYNNKALDELYVLLDYNPLDILDKEEKEEEEEEGESTEEEEESIENIMLNSRNALRLFKQSHKKYFFNWKRHLSQVNPKDLFNNSYFNFFNKTTSLDLFFIFYLTGYSVFENQEFDTTLILSKINTSFCKVLPSNYVTYYNNIYPMFLFPEFILEKLAKKQYALKHGEFSLFFRHHLGGFLESATQKKLFIKVITRMKITLEILLFIKNITTQHMFFQKLVGRGFFLEEMIFIMWQSFYQKDLDFLVTWVQRIMSKIDLHKHRSFLKVFRFILVKYWFFFYSTTHILGFKFDIRGKIGLTGNAKKKNTSFGFGSTSFSTKKHRLEFRQGLVGTETGVLGLTFILTF